MCNASILNWTSWWKSRWKCCPFKESDAGILNLVLSPSASVQIDSPLCRSHFIDTVTFLYCPALIFASCLPYLVILAFWVNLSHDYLWIACLLKVSSVYDSKDKEFLLKMYVKSWILKDQFSRSKIIQMCDNLLTLTISLKQPAVDQKPHQNCRCKVMLNDAPSDLGSSFWWLRLF